MINYTDNEANLKMEVRCDTLHLFRNESEFREKKGGYINGDLVLPFENIRTYRLVRRVVHCS